MKSIFAFCLVLGLICFAGKAFALTNTTTYTQIMDAPSSGAVGDMSYAWVFIDCGDNTCDLVCEEPGGKDCHWDATICLGCEEGLSDASGQDMFDHAIAQIDASVPSGTYVNNIIPPTGTKYFRSITWGYNAAANKYTLVLTLTEVTP